MHFFKWEGNTEEICRKERLLRGGQIEKVQNGPYWIIGIAGWQKMGVRKLSGYRWFLETRTQDVFLKQKALKLRLVTHQGFPPFFEGLLKCLYLLSQ